jgi:hypothetical protein
VEEAMACLADGEFGAYDAGAGDVAGLPFGDRCFVAAVEAGGGGEAGGAGGANAAGFEGVESGVALVARPEEAEGRGGVTAGAGEALAAGDAFEFAERLGLFEAAPAVHGGVGGDETCPDGLGPEGETDEASDTNESEDRGNHEAAGASERIPEKRAKDLAPVERINGKDVEDEEHDVGGENGAEEAIFIGHGVAPLGRLCELKGSPENWEQGDVDEGASGDAPESGAGALGWVDIGYAAEGPEEDGVGFAADGAAGEGMAELVEEDDGEQGEVFEDVPDGRGVVALAGLDFVDGDEEPGPVEEDGDSGDAEDAKRTLAAEHAGSLMEWSARVAGKAR